jgi:hypothetical protein
MINFFIILNILFIIYISFIVINDLADLIKLYIDYLMYGEILYFFLLIASFIVLQVLIILF